MPCSNCLRSRKQEACVYEDEQPTKSTRRRRLSGHDHDVLSSPTLSRNSNAESLLMHRPENSTGHDSTTAVSPATSIDATRGEASLPKATLFLKDRIKQLEEQVSKLSPSEARTPSSFASVATPASDIETQTSQLGGTYHIHHPAEPTITTYDAPKPPSEQRSLLGRTPGMSISRNISHKTRLFGQSHWFNTVATLVRGPWKYPHPQRTE